MAEKETRVVTVQVEYTCDSCNEGLMLAAGHVQDSNPPMYAHRCNHCSTVDYFDSVYPRLEHRKVGRQQPEQSPQLQVGTLDEV